MGETFLSWALSLLMAHPVVAMIVTSVAGFMVTMFTASRALEVIGIGLRPLAKVIPGVKDDRLLERFIWWVDAVADISEPLSRMKWRRAWSVLQRVRTDYGKPLSLRRREDGPEIVPKKATKKK